MTLQQTTVISFSGDF